MTRVEQLLQLHKTVYVGILLKSIEDRTTEESDFSSWYEEKNTEEAGEIKEILRNRGLYI